MAPASAQLRVNPERKDGGHPTLCNVPPQWLRMRHQSHQKSHWIRMRHQSPKSLVRSRHRRHQGHQSHPGNRPRKAAPEVQILLRFGLHWRPRRAGPYWIHPLDLLRRSNRENGVLGLKTPGLPDSFELQIEDLWLLRFQTTYRRQKASTKKQAPKSVRDSVRDDRLRRY